MIFNLHQVYYKSIIWGLTIFILSVTPGKAFPKVGILNFDKVVHLGIYGIFAFLMYLEIYKSGISVKVRVNIVKILIITAIVGGGIELIQGTPIVSRSCDFFDFLANMLGGGLGVAAFDFVRRKSYFNVRS